MLALLLVSASVAAAHFPVAPTPAPQTPPPAPCTGPTCFSFVPDWKSGSAATTLPTANFSVRKLEAVYYPPDSRVYAYVDIVNYTDLYYPASYSAEIGAYSSPDGFTNWSCEYPLLLLLHAVRWFSRAQISNLTLYVLTLPQITGSSLAAVSRAGGMAAASPPPARQLRPTVAWSSALLRRKAPVAASTVA